VPSRCVQPSPLSHKKAQKRNSHKKAQKHKIDLRAPTPQNYFVLLVFLFVPFVANLLVCGRGGNRLIPAPFLSTPDALQSPCRDRDYNSNDRRPRWSTSSARACPGIGPPVWARYRHQPAGDKRDSFSPASHPPPRVLPSSKPPRALRFSMAP